MLSSDGSKIARHALLSIFAFKKSAAMCLQAAAGCVSADRLHTVLCLAATTRKLHTRFSPVHKATVWLTPSSDTLELVKDALHKGSIIGTDKQVPMISQHLRKMIEGAPSDVWPSKGQLAFCKASAASRSISY